jgi:hypothetical protein
MYPIDFSVKFWHASGEGTFYGDINLPISIRNLSYGTGYNYQFGCKEFERKKCFAAGVPLQLSMGFSSKDSVPEVESFI